MNYCSDNLKSKSGPADLKPKWVVGIITFVITFAVCGVAGTQPAKIPRIGFLGASSFSANAARLEAFRQGLRELGYAEGKNIVIELAICRGKARSACLTSRQSWSLLKVDIIVSAGPAAYHVPSRKRPKTIPIVMTQDNDPVGTGFVASLGAAWREYYRLVHPCP